MASWKTMEEEQYFHPNGQTVISWPNKVDLSHLCRICANSNEYLIPIFDGEGTENDLELKIKTHLPIKVKDISLYLTVLGFNFIIVKFHMQLFKKKKNLV